MHFCCQVTSGVIIIIIVFFFSASNKLLITSHFTPLNRREQKRGKTPGKNEETICEGFVGQKAASQD